MSLVQPSPLSGETTVLAWFVGLLAAFVVLCLGFHLPPRLALGFSVALVFAWLAVRLGKELLRAARDG